MFNGEYLMFNSHINSTKVEGESAYQLDFTIDTSSPVEVGQNISVAISLVNVVTPANYRLTVSFSSYSTTLQLCIYI